MHGSYQKLPTCPGCFSSQGQLLVASWTSLQLPSFGLANPQLLDAKSTPKTTGDCLASLVIHYWRIPTKPPTARSRTSCLNMEGDMASEAFVYKAVVERWLASISLITHNTTSTSHTTNRYEIHHLSVKDTTYHLICWSPSSRPAASSAESDCTPSTDPSSARMVSLH
jgi:hypothetical protein